MRKTKSTVVALSTVAALLATGGAATAVAMTGSDASPASADASQSQAQTDKNKDKKDKRAHGKAKRHAKHPPKGDGAKALCKRAPKIDKRIDRLQRRLDGGLKTRGSVERLEQRVENAKKANHDVIADFLGERLDDRGERKLTLKEREEGLKKVRAWCATQDEGKDEKKSDESGEG